MKFTNQDEMLSFIALCEKRYRADVMRCVDAARSKKGLQYIALSGPTCSGKTTTASFLINELKKYGFESLVISIDNFFIDRAVIFAEAKRKGVPPDMDSVNAIDLDGLKDFINCVEKGEAATLPFYDFEKGERSGGEAVFPKENLIYIFEGIQAFYPEVLSLFDADKLLRISISVERPYETEDYILSEREQRLLRRILRDSKFRGTDAQTTLFHWGEVVNNELLHIEPYRQNADISIDSSMPYELCVMKDELIPILQTVSDKQFAGRYITILSSLPSISRELVPRDSVIREFIG